MKALSAADILAADDHEVVQVEVPEWGGYVYLRTLTGADRDRFEASIATTPNGQRNFENFRARYLAITVCDEQGSLLFDAKQIKELGAKRASVLDRLFDRASKLNAVSKEDVDELLGNSEADPSGDSISD